MRDTHPTREALASLAARHGVALEKVRPLPSGEANHVLLLGDELVLRVPRSENFVPDLVKEAAVIPAARRAGVRTPEVVTFDAGCSLLEVPYMVLARAPGVDLARLDPPETHAQEVFHQVGRELAKLHRLPTSAPTALPDAVPADEDAEDPRSLVARLLADGYLDAGSARWLRGWFDRLAPLVPPAPPRVLVHGDIAPQNLLVSPDATVLGGIVDWGDALWADSATEFAKVPLLNVPALLDGYRQENEADEEPGSWEARVLWHHLAWALARLKAPSPAPGRRHWTAPPAARLLGLLRFLASSPPPPWDGLV
ncbi:aminoglycoside phosphotransferase family protein [Streptomyces sp. NPDC003077]|uniref:phosphotransferase family protein n=1 Tax=Streptomyces sp. NPDC003077 TaxID=3154443 RepID=UPI0033AC48DE